MKKSYFKRLLTGVLAAAVAAASLSIAAVTTVSADSTFDDLNQTQIVEAMGAGYNLGNQLEATLTTKPSETAWGNPKITKEFIQTIKDAGFSTIRIPVSYFGYIGGADSGYEIDEDWLDRVQEVIDYAIDAGLYVITNVHGDGYYSMTDYGAWLLCAEDDEAQTYIKAKYKAVWEQIATRFKDYDEHLIFESMNEEFDGTYNNQDWSAYENINDYNQIFVDTVRQTGGNNAKRWLLIPGWDTNIGYTVNAQDGYSFEIPTDTYRDSSIPEDEQRIMISVHYYDPYNFAQNEGTSSVAVWGTDEEKQAVEDAFLQCYKAFVLEGYPVVIGEYGSIDKTGEEEDGDPTNTSCRAEFAKTICTEARSMGIVPVYWDNGWNGTHGFGIFNRSTCAQTQPEIISAIMEAYEGDAEPAPEVIDPITKDEALGVIYSGKKADAVTLAEGTADSTMAGATQVRLTFDCADDVSFNQYAAINILSTIASDNQKNTSVAGSSDVQGATALTATSDLSSEVKEGDAYSIACYTGSWNDASDYVYLIRSVEFLDADGNVLKTIVKEDTEEETTTAEEETTTAEVESTTDAEETTTAEVETTTAEAETTTAESTTATTTTTTAATTAGVTTTASTTAAGTTAAATTTTSGGTTTASTDSAVNTGAEAALGMTAFALAGVAGIIAYKKRRK